MTNRLYAWQVPISGTGRYAHYLMKSKQTKKVVPAACGMEFNPGFAVPEKPGQKRCLICEMHMKKGAP